MENVKLSKEKPIVCSAVTELHATQVADTIPVRAEKEGSLYTFTI